LQLRTGLLRSRTGSLSGKVRISTRSDCRAWSEFMQGFVTYDFRMDGWQPETLPLKRLSEYTAELAKLFGSGPDIHLMKIRRGSAVPEIAVASSADSAVSQRLALLGGPDMPADLARPYWKINDYLREDGGSAVLKRKGGAKIISFPGVRTLLADEVMVHETGSLEGTVIRVGGMDDTVPVWLEGENREKLQCTASRPIARELAHHLFDGILRVTGQGKWCRSRDGRWSLDGFVIKSWELLDNVSMIESVEKLRAIPDNGWAELDDPQAEWRRIRG
jgi:hypothetical protein